MDTNTLIERLVADYEFCLETPEEFTVGTGKAARLSTTSVMRTVTALNIEATRAQFVAAMALVGVNAATAAKQFAISRKVTLEDGGVVLLADGSMMEVA
jgi:hypothetical protein